MSDVECRGAGESEREGEGERVAGEMRFKLCM